MSGHAGARKQRGVALLTALVLVALATVMAVTIGFDSNMSARRSVASLGMEQALSLAQGAEAGAALVLNRDDAKTDAKADTWAQAIPPFEVAPEVGIELEMRDEQGKFNLNTLIKVDGTPDEEAVKVFKQLLELLQIESRWADMLVDRLDANTTPQPDGGEDSLYLSQTPPQRTPNLPMASVSELEQLPGFGRERYLKLLPHVTALPASVRTINACTATGEVLDALSALGGTPSQQFSRLQPGELEKEQRKGCFPGSQTLSAQIPAIRTHVEDKSSYFLLRTRVRIGATRYALYSLMYRDTSGVRPIVRTFGTD